MITLQNLTVQFGGARPLDDLSVVLEGQICGIIGPNGAGKTTLLNVLSGFVTPAAGQVRFAGIAAAGSPAQRARQGIRRSFQAEQIADDLTLWENVMVGAENFGIPHALRAPAVIRAMQLAGVDGVADLSAARANTYQRRLTEIARAITGTPRFVLLDEPGAGLSHAESDGLRDLIRAIPAATGAFVCLIDHDVDLIAACCDRLAVLDFGTLLACGDCTSVLADDKVKTAYLGI